MTIGGVSHDVHYRYKRNIIETVSSRTEENENRDQLFKRRNELKLLGQSTREIDNLLDKFWD